MALRGRLRWMQACGSKSLASRWLDSSLVHSQKVWNLGKARTQGISLKTIYFLCGQNRLLRSKIWLTSLLMNNAFLRLVKETVPTGAVFQWMSQIRRQTTEGRDSWCKLNNFYLEFLVTKIRRHFSLQSSGVENDRFFSNFPGASSPVNFKPSTEALWATRLDANENCTEIDRTGMWLETRW